MHRLKKRSSLRQRLIHLAYSHLANVETRSSFCERVLNDYNTSDATDTSYSRLGNAVQKASTDTLPKKARAQPGWFIAAEDSLLPLIMERNRATSCLFGRRLRADTLRLRAARKALCSAVAKAKNRWIIEQCCLMNQICASGTGTKQSWGMNAA